MWSCAAKLTPKWRRRQATPRDRGSSPEVGGPPTAEELGALPTPPTPPTFPGATPPRAARDADADASANEIPRRPPSPSTPLRSALEDARTLREQLEKERAAHAALREDMDREQRSLQARAASAQWNREAAAGGGAQAIEPPKPRPKTTLEQLLGITCGVRLACDDEGNWEDPEALPAWDFSDGATTAKPAEGVRMAAFSDAADRQASGKAAGGAGDVPPAPPATARVFEASPPRKPPTPIGRSTNHAAYSV